MGFNVDRYGEKVSGLCVQHVCLILDQHLLGHTHLVIDQPKPQCLYKSFRDLGNGNRQCNKWLDDVLQKRGADLRTRYLEHT